MYEPSQFQINDTWIAFKLNDAPLSTNTDGDFNVFALIDAASCFILGTEFFSANSTELSQLESKRLLKTGYAHKQQYPKTIFIPTNLPASILGTEADRQGIAVVRVSEEELSVFVDDVRQGFQKDVGGGKFH